MFATCAQETHTSALTVVVRCHSQLGGLQVWILRAAKATCWSLISSVAGLEGGGTFKQWDLSRGLVIVTDGEPRPFLSCSLQHKVKSCVLKFSFTRMWSLTTDSKRHSQWLMNQNLPTWAFLRRKSPLSFFINTNLGCLWKVPERWPTNGQKQSFL